MAEGFQIGRIGGTSYCRVGAGQPLVLVHGVGMHSGFWAPQIAAFASGFDVIAYDALGHGGSVLPSLEASLVDYSAQLLALLDGLGLGQVCLVGHSMGALIALDFALAHPERVKAVVPMNAVYCRSPEQELAVASRAQTLASGRHDTGWRQAAIDRWFGAPVPAAQLEVTAWVAAALTSLNPVGYARAYGLFARADRTHEGVLDKLACPALFLTGEEDANSTPEMSRRMAAEAPYGRAKILPGQRHMMSLVAPDIVNRALYLFLTESALACAAQ
jgi:(E)-2-((N-methylformamido)methylene)succinate hydrolase